MLVSAAALGGLVAGRGLAFVPQKVIEGPLTLANFVKGTTDCFDRSKRPLAEALHPRHRLCGRGW